MKLKLQIEKHGARLFADTYDISDAETFGNACADAFDKLRGRRLEKATSIGAVLEDINNYALEDLQDARITLSKA